MSLRFGSKPKQSTTKNMIISLLCFILILVLFTAGVSKVSAKTDEKAKETLSQAISRDVMRCYTLEGFYPEDLDYLKENYGLIYDEDRFVVDYQPLGQNIMPDVTIIDKEAK